MLVLISQRSEPLVGRGAAGRVPSEGTQLLQTDPLPAPRIFLCNWIQVVVSEGEGAAVGQFE